MAAILDVSTKGRFLKSPIKGTTNIPYDEIEHNLERPYSHFGHREAYWRNPRPIF